MARWLMDSHSASIEYKNNGVVIQRCRASQHWKVAHLNHTSIGKVHQHLWAVPDAEPKKTLTRLLAGFHFVTNHHWFNGMELFRRPKFCGTVSDHMNS